MPNKTGSTHVLEPKTNERSCTMETCHVCCTGGQGKVAGTKSCSSLVSPESSIGGHSDHPYAWHDSTASTSALHDLHSHTAAREQDTSQGQGKSRPCLPELDSSQPGPIEIDTSLLYTPQSGASSTDVSQSGDTSCIARWASYTPQCCKASSDLDHHAMPLLCDQYSAPCHETRDAALDITSAKAWVMYHLLFIRPSHMQLLLQPIHVT